MTGHSSCGRGAMEVVIVGSGPSAAAAALALDETPDVAITVLDLGGELESERVTARSAMARTAPDSWRPNDLQLVSARPESGSPGELPTKQIYGSNFPFQDFGQLDRIGADAGANRLVVSGAYGGFSNTWGAQVMPYSTGTFRTWPIARSDLEPHYRDVLERIPYAAESDDLEETFPLMGAPDRLPKVTARTAGVLRRYEKHRIKVRAQGVIVGHARLALRASACRLCGLCMTGCPYELIYSASQTFDELRSRRRVAYRSGVRVHRIEERDDGVSVHAIEIATRQPVTLRADKVFIGAGAIGTTRIVANSLGLTDRTVRMAESVQYMVPFLSRKPETRLSQQGEFTLNQFNLFVSFDSDGKDAALVHCYPYNDIMVDALPAVVATGPLSALGRRGLRHLTVGLGYLPSWASPSVDLRIGLAEEDGTLPPVRVKSGENEMTKPMLKRVIRQLRRCGPALDLFPIPGQTRISAPAKSYHFGGSFPMTSGGEGEFRSDLLGRVGPWRNVHLIDGSVFPTVPATTFTLTVMANAHRIAADAVGAT
ncbi:choline dehydrogenase-like flavoprotein [Mycobacterium sp. OAS707]|nr:choline dehydrogenase-like flavoprotein [Mycobacterium sp. OAS707]